VLAGVLLFFGLASIGLPGLNNFVSEFLVVLGTFVTTKPYAVVAVTALVLSAIYFLWAYQRMMHGPPVIAGASDQEDDIQDAEGPEPGPAFSREERRGPLWDLTAREYLIVVPLVAAVLFLGLYPQPVLSRIDPSAGATCAGVVFHTAPDFRAAHAQAVRKCGFASARLYTLSGATSEGG